MANKEGSAAILSAGRHWGSTPSSANSHVTGRVLYTLLTDDPTQLKEMNVPPGSVGAIKFRVVSNSKEDSGFGVAYPLNSIAKYPVPNELVNIVAGPSKYNSNAQGANIFSWYYDNIHPIFDSPEHNALPNDTDYKNSGTHPVTGPTFSERGDIYKLQHLPGDTIIEGRFGNSIRIGSSNDLIPESPWQGKQGNPVVVITNGQKVQTAKNISAVFEDINGDGSSIWMLSGHNITFVPASLNFDSYGTGNPSTEQKNNIITSTTQITPTTGSLQQVDTYPTPVVDTPPPVSIPVVTETPPNPPTSNEIEFLPDTETGEEFQIGENIEVGENDYVNVSQYRPPLYVLSGGSNVKTVGNKQVYDKASAIAAISKGLYPSLPLLPFKSTVFTIKQVADELNSIRRANPTKVNLQLLRSVLATAINEQGGSSLHGFNYDFFGIQADIGHPKWAFGPIFTGLNFSGQVIALEGSTKKYRAYLAFASLTDSLKYTIDAHQRKGFSTAVSLTANDAMEYANTYVEYWNSPDKKDRTPAYIASKSKAYNTAKQYIR